MPSTFTSPDEASSHLEVASTCIFDLFDDLWMHTHCILSKQRNLDTMSTDQQNCLLRAALRTVELNDNLIERINQCRESLRAWNAAFSGTRQTKENIVSHMSTQIFFFCIWFWIETWRDTTAMNQQTIGPTLCRSEKHMGNGIDGSTVTRDCEAH